MHELEITINTDARFVKRQTENGWRHLFGSGSFAVDIGPLPAKNPDAIVRIFNPNTKKL
jgi:2-methylaconitate cis-trans-isomerase PrpF